MKQLSCIILVYILFPFILNAQFNEDYLGTTSLFGGSFGMAFPSGESDPELNASAIYLFHNQVSSGYAFETQVAGLISTASAYNDGWKFVLPADVRFYLGSMKLAAFASAGIQYTMVSSGQENYISFPDEKQSQFASNLAFGFRTGFWKQHKHSFILGTKIHFPIVSSEYLYDKTVVAIIGGIGFTNSWGAVKLDYEYPFGKGYGNSVYGINSQAFSISFLFNISNDRY